MGKKRMRIPGLPSRPIKSDDLMDTPLHDLSGLGFLRTQPDLISSMNHSPLGGSNLTFTPSVRPLLLTMGLALSLEAFSDYSARSTSWPGREQRLSFLDHLQRRNRKPGASPQPGAAASWSGHKLGGPSPEMCSAM